MHKLTRVTIFLALACGLALACDRNAATNGDLLLVQEVIAAQLKAKPEDIDPQKTLGDLGADELDVVEVVMELEDRLKISISDEALAKVAGTDKPNELVSRLTVAQLAGVVTSSRGG